MIYHDSYHIFMNPGMRSPMYSRVKTMWGTGPVDGVHGAGGTMHVENPRYHNKLHDVFFEAARQHLNMVSSPTLTSLIGVAHRSIGACS